MKLLKVLLILSLIIFLLIKIPPVNAQSAFSQWVTAVGDPKGPPPGGFFSIVEWDERILSHLVIGSVFGLMNRLTPAGLESNEAGYSTGNWPSTNLGDLYWCTRSVVDAYNLAGFIGLTQNAHAAVINMRDWWWTGQGNALGYVFVEYNLDWSSDQKKAALSQVKPGFAVMWMQDRTRFTDNEHVAIVQSILTDGNGNGEIDYLQSNSSHITGKLQFHDWTIPKSGGPLRGVVGFGGPPGSGGVYNPNLGNPSDNIPNPQADNGTLDINALFAKLPGNSSATVVLPGGQTVNKDGGAAKPSYSAVKVFVAAAAFQAQSNGTIDLNNSYILKSSDFACAPGSDINGVCGTGILSRNTDVGKKYTYMKLIETMLYYSDNTATNVLINALGGFSTVNQFVQNDGYNQTSFKRYFAAPVTNPENTTSSNDLVKFYQDLFAKKLAGSDELIGVLQQRMVNENPSFIYLGKSLPSSANLVEKSGNTTHIRNDGGSFVTKSGQRVFIAIMLSDLSDDGAAETAIGNTASSIYNSLP